MDDNDIPMIISTDDHVIEPPHTWQYWLPDRFKDRAPRVERRKVGAMKLAMGGGKMIYDVELDVEDGRWADVWFFEDVVMPQGRETAAIGFPLMNEPGQ